jgi:serine/threonine protein phosphatase PrpC
MMTDLETSPRIFADCDMHDCEAVRLVGGSACVFSSRSPEKSTANEDAAALVSFDAQSGVLIVADGLGGEAGGAQAASLAVLALSTAIERTAAAGGSLREAILDGFELANRDVQALGIGAATTLLVAEIGERSVRTYHVGDSMALVTGQRGRIKLQTVCHSPVGYAVEAGLLDEDAAMQHDERHVVSNVIGRADMRIEIGSSLPLSPFDTVLLGSDGLFDNLPVSEIVQRIRKGRLDRAIDALATDARGRMLHPQAGLASKPDDLTIVAFRRGVAR